MYDEDLLLDHKPEMLTPELVRRADLILAMDGSLLTTPGKTLPRGKTFSLKEFFGEKGDVEDPWPDGMDPTRFQSIATARRNCSGSSLSTSTSWCAHWNSRPAQRRVGYLRSGSTKREEGREFVLGWKYPRIHSLPHECWHRLSAQHQDPPRRSFPFAESGMQEDNLCDLPSRLSLRDWR
jgi:hypothetical protein